MRPLLCCLALLTGCVGFHSKSGGRSSRGTKASTAVEASVPAGWQPQWREVGRSVEGRSLRVTSVGYGPRRVLWVGGIHGNEREGRISTAELPYALLAAEGGPERVTLTILEDANPDGTARNTRGNARGVDLNRNYPAKNFKPNPLFGLKPLDQPEARVLHDLILQLRPHLVIVAHSWHDDHFINYDGPARELAQRFAERSGYRLKESDTFAETPGSLGSWVGGALKLPILTLEYHRGREPWAAWQETREAILAVVLEG